MEIHVLLQPDPAHSETEARYYVLGQTNAGRQLFVTFTIRNDNIRFISTREISRKERKAYGEAYP
ncbi:MAG: BrnT family toxin [Anaerolineales bacterium]|nr:BrnT family toxin [Anaerolineales bacterium]